MIRLLTYCRVTHNGCLLCGRPVKHGGKLYMLSKGTANPISNATIFAVVVFAFILSGFARAALFMTSKVNGDCESKDLKLSRKHYQTDRGNR